MAVLDPVVIRFGAARVAGKTMALTELLEVVAAACDELVHVGLVAGVPQDDVARAFEDPVQRDGQFNGAEIRAKVTARFETEFTTNSRISRQSSSSWLRSRARRSAGTRDLVEIHVRVTPACGRLAKLHR